MTTPFSKLAHTLATKLHGRSAWPQGRPGADIRHDADLRRVLRDLDAFP